jgi:hypothetical protein
MYKSKSPAGRFAALATGALLQRKPLESTRGFFVHLMRTFPIITPYLKGMHLTLEGWRPNRDEEMWKLQPKLGRHLLRMLFRHPHLNWSQPLDWPRMCSVCYTFSKALSHPPVWHAVHDD